MSADMSVMRGRVLFVEVVVNSKKILSYLTGHAYGQDILHTTNRLHRVLCKIPMITIDLIGSGIRWLLGSEVAYKWK